MNDILPNWLKHFRMRYRTGTRITYS